MKVIKGKKSIKKFTNKKESRKRKVQNIEKEKKGIK